MKNTRKFRSLLCLVLAVVMLLSVGATAAFADDRVEGGTVYYAVGDNLGEFFTPYKQGGLSGMGWPCYQPLAWNTDSGDWMPCLAESWERNNEEYSLTLHLVQNACFSDGTPFTADDVVFSLASRKEYNNDSAIGAPVSVEKIDDYTVKVTWDKFSLSYEQWILTQFMFSKKAFDENGLDWMLNNMMGTGPYKLTEFIPDVSLTYERNENYWGSPASPDRIKVMYIADPMTMLASFLGGEIDRFLSGDPVVVDQLLAAGFEPVKLNSTAEAQFLAIPLSVEESDPLYKTEVRQAIFEHGVDWQTMALGLGGSVGYHTDAIGLTGMSYYDPSIEKSSYDLEKAKQMLADAGYADGFKTTIYTSAPFADAATVLQSELKKLNIETSVEFVDYSLVQSDYISAKATRTGICITCLFIPSTPQNDRFVKHINPFGTYGPSSTWQDEIYPLWSAVTSATTQEEEDAALLAYVNSYVHNGSNIWPMYNTATLMFNQDWFKVTENAQANGTTNPMEIWTTRK